MPVARGLVCRGYVRTRARSESWLARSVAVAQGFSESLRLRPTQARGLRLPVPSAMPPGAGPDGVACQPQAGWPRRQLPGPRDTAPRRLRCLRG